MGDVREIGKSMYVNLFPNMRRPF